MVDQGVQEVIPLYAASHRLEQMQAGHPQRAIVLIQELWSILEALLAGVDGSDAVQAVVQRQLRDIAADHVEPEQQQHGDGHERLHRGHDRHDDCPQLRHVAQQPHHPHDFHQPQDPQHAHQRQGDREGRHRLPVVGGREAVLQQLHRDHNKVEDIPPSAGHREEPFAEGDEPQHELRGEESREDLLRQLIRVWGGLLRVPCAVVGLHADGRRVHQDEGDGE
mmetsp:Transcript_36680/g.118508  ORF Transcript_36680/g.118508 Transcript_36680/m.118508 type:complete len:222 (+) Transcript_36680:573-1238(+)